MWQITMTRDNANRAPVVPRHMWPNDGLVNRFVPVGMNVLKRYYGGHLMLVGQRTDIGQDKLQLDVV